jgi:EmrB/QacA subfamily drug resistance transporter
MAQASAAATSVSPGVSRRWWAFAAVQSGFFMALVDGSVVNIALPTMLVDFNVDIETVKWVSIGYLFAITVSLLSIGRLADIFGRKRTTILGFATFTVASVLCALAPTFEVLVLCRVIQGLGGACLMANALAIIGALFPRDQRGHPMAIQALLVAVAQVTGPVLGGALIAASGWRSIFLINLPIGLLGLGLSLWALREQEVSPGREKAGGFDWLGAALSVVALGALFMALEEFSDAPSKTMGTALLLVGIVALVAFVFVERRVPQPILALELFRARTFTLSSVAVACAILAIASVSFVMPFYLQVVLGYSPLQSGLLLTPTALGIVVAGPLAGTLMNRLSTRVLATVGLLIAVVALALIGQLNTGSQVSDVVMCLALLGFGMGLFFPPNNVSVMSETPPERLSIGAAFFSMMRMMGQFLGATVTAEILGNHLDRVGGIQSVEHGGGTQPHETIVAVFLAGQTLVFQVVATIVLVGVLASALRGSAGESGRARGGSAAAGSGAPPAAAGAE